MTVQKTFDVDFKVADNFFKTSVAFDRRPLLDANKFLSVPVPHFAIPIPFAFGIRLIFF